MKEKQQQLLFDKGITNVPSDALCSDNALAESIGMVYDNGEHRVIQKPEEFMTESKKILFVHKFDTYTHYILFYEIGNVNVLAWRTENDTTPHYICNPSDMPQITAIGKTLIVNDSSDVKYYLWKQDNYMDLGVIPVPNPEYQMCKFEANANSIYVKNPIDAPGYGDSEYWYKERTDVVKHTMSFEGIFNTTKDFDSGAREPGDESAAWQEKHQEDYNNLVLGCYSKNKKSVAENNCFCNPFFVRIALELYDGTYYHIGAPMLMLPSVESNSWVRLSGGFNFTLYTICRQLAVKQSVDYTDWSDIVKDVVLFVSDDIDVNETTMDIPIYQSHGTFEAKSFCSDSIGGTWILENINAGNAFSDLKHTDTQDTLRYHFNPFKPRTNTDMNASIEGVSIFHRLCSLGIDAIDWISTREKIEKHTLENINTQEQLQYDDYFSGCPLKSGYLYAYNSRLNLANVARGFFGGYNYDAVYDVDIDINGAIKRIGHSDIVSNKAQCFYFFYPDPRAKKCGNHDLKEHPGLNGAYYFKGLQALISQGDNASSGAGTNSGTPSPAFSGNYESLQNYILTSEANNPFSFLAGGYNRVGTDEVLAITANTHALSEGQFGQHPLIVFSRNGIWAMALDGTGLFVSIHPVSREVCNNPKSVIQTDGAVFFSSDKGLMVIVGSQVKCVSEQLSGKTQEFTIGETPYEDRLVINYGNFCELLKKSFIAYDYRDSLLWILNDESPVCYVYSIKSGTFAHYDFGDTQITNVANNYPDFLLQDSSKVYSLTGRKDINEDSDDYSAAMVTRSMKLENALALKSIMQVKHIHDMNDNATLALRIFASNNLKNWVELRSLRGTPWKYYRFSYDFANLKATDRFAGTMLITQERRTDKLR